MSSKTILFLSVLVLVFIFLSFLSAPTALKVPQVSLDTDPVENNSEVSVYLIGDVMLGRSVMIKSLEANDPSYPFRYVAERLRSADIVFVNLENPIIYDCPKHEGGFVFCAPPTMAEGLTYSGIDVVNLANNHSRNYGEIGIAQTLEYLGERGILATGLGELVSINKAGFNFGFLGFDYTVNEPSIYDYELIRNSDKKVDVLIVGVHWGVEYTGKPQEYQREWARAMVDAGADVIVGHHPHWVQTSEEISGIPVFYSLGNFIFDQMWSEETRQGLAVKLTFKGRTLQGRELLPTYMENWAQPEFIE